MKKIAYFLALAGLLFLVLSCNEIDNYPGPTAGIYGRIVDTETNQPIESEQPNGFRIRMFEKGYASVQPFDFWGKADGTFRNTKVFTGTYKVIPIEAAFVQPDTQTVTLTGLHEVEFKTVPFLRIMNPKITTSAGKVIAEYGLSRSIVTAKIIERKLLVSTVPTVSNTTNTRNQTTNTSSVDDAALLRTTFKDEVTGLTPGTYYVRVAACTNNPLKRYNYSPAVKVTVP